MNWNNLKKNKCPKCGKDLGTMFYDGRDRGQFIFCSNVEKCDFKITPKRMKEIVGNQVTRDLDKYHHDMDEGRQNWD